MKYTTTTEINRLERGEKVDYLFFWGHRRQKDNTIGKGCLSQWYDKGFTYENVYYSSAEHWMMAEKARIFKDDEIRKQIFLASSPKEAKALGRKVSNFNSEEWDSGAYEIVVKGNWLKFGQNPALKKFLLSTANKVLVEASPYDRIWGIGMLANDERAHDPRKWRGKNLLGFALMEVRDELKF